MDFARNEITVRQGNGGKDRVTMLPVRVAIEMKEHLVRVKAIHQLELKAGRSDVELPNALARKYPRAAYQWPWQYVFRPRIVERSPIRRHSSPPHR